MKSHRITRNGVLLLLVLFPSIITADKTRTRRDVHQLSYLIRCQTDRDPMDYLGYGCWCGYGGSEKPMDDVDRCCFNHDKCYDDLYDSGVCEGNTMYTQEYSYHNNEECPRQNGLQCSLDHGDCALGLCRCDDEVSQCLGEAEFRDEYYRYSRFISCSWRKYLCSWFGC